MQELQAYRSRVGAEQGDLSSKLRDAEGKIAEMNKLKQLFQRQIEELRSQIDDEARQKQQLTAQFTSVQFEKQQLKEAIEEEQENNSEMRRLISKVGFLATIGINLGE